jgi:Ca-activated chloride channel homolog
MIEAYLCLLRRITSSRQITLAIIVPCIFLVSTSSGQTPIDDTQNDRLTVLTVTVKNQQREYVLGLSRDSMVLMDEKEIRPIESFELVDSAMSIGIAIDISSSMQLFDVRNFARAKPLGEALARFLELGNPNNEYFLVAFDRSPRFLTDWSSRQILNARKTTISVGSGNTALYDSCFAALEKLRTGRHPKRALLLITDGQDTASVHTLAELRRLLKSLGYSALCNWN